MDRPLSGLTPEQRGNHDDGCDALKGSLSGSQSHAAAPRASAQRSTSFWHRPERARDRRAREIRPVAKGVANRSDGDREGALRVSRSNASRAAVMRNGHASQGPWASSMVQHPEFCPSIKTGKKRSADPNFETARARPVYRNGAWPEFRAAIRARVRVRASLPAMRELRAAVRARERDVESLQSASKPLHLFREQYARAREAVSHRLNPTRDMSSENLIVFKRRLQYAKMTT